MWGFWILWILVVLALSSVPFYPYSRGWGYRPVILIVVLLGLWLALIYGGLIFYEWPWAPPERV